MFLCLAFLLSIKVIARLKAVTSFFKIDVISASTLISALRLSLMDLIEVAFVISEIETPSFSCIEDFFFFDTSRRMFV